MAKNIKKTASGEFRGISAEELKRVVKEHKRQADNASEYAGHAGQVIKTAVEKHNLDLKALRFAIGLSKMDEAKRQGIIRAFIDYANKLDFFSATDAFDDVVAEMEAICKEIRERADKPRKADPVVSAVLQ